MAAIPLVYSFIFYEKKNFHDLVYKSTVYHPFWLTLAKFINQPPFSVKIKYELIFDPEDHLIDLIAQLMDIVLIHP